jgi:hypothetical protein
MRDLKFPFSVRIALLILLVLIGGCAYGPIKPQDVKEYRYFPEYRGYFPIVDQNVRADWVLPEGLTPEGKPDYTSPQTREEAEKRVKETANKEKVLHPKLTGSIAALLLPPAQILMVAVVVPGLIVSPVIVPMAEAHEKKVSRKKQQALEKKQQELEKFAGVKVSIQVMDDKGNGIPDTRVIEVASPMDIPTFVDEEGSRSFAPVSYGLYALSPKTVELLARDLPAYPGDKESLADQKGDPSGTVKYTSLAVARFAQFTEKSGWQWARTPIPLTLSFIVWAPGFNPSIYTAANVHHGDALNTVISLEKAESLTPQSADNSYNIWSLKARFDNFVLYILPIAEGYIDPKTVEEARDLLKKGEAVDPDFPGLDNLRAIIALADGDRERAVSLSHYLSHYSFFKQFYGLSVSLPQY